MERNFEQELKNSLNHDIEIPKSIFDKAQGAFKEIRGYNTQRATKNFLLVRKGWVAAAVAVVVLGVTFNQPVIAAIKATFWGNHAGIERAVENGYQQEVQGASVKSQGIETKVTNVVIDKSKLGLAINMKFDDIKSIKDIDHVYLDLLITDGNGRVISGDGYPERLDGGSEYSTDIANKNSGEFKYNVLFQSPTASFPQMSELKVIIKSVSLSKNKGDGPQGYFKKIVGPWNNSVALDEQFVKAKGVAYTSQSTSNDVNVISAEMLPTGFAVKFIVNTPVDESIVNEARTQLVDSKGNSFSNSGIANMERTADNKDLVSMVYEVSGFDQSDTFKFIIKDINGKDFVATLVRATK